MYIIFINILFLLVAIKKKILTITGGITAFIIGIMSVIFGGSYSYYLLCMFLISAVIVEKTAKRILMGKDEKECRNSKQVWAISSIFLCCLFLYYYTEKEIYILLSVTVLGGSLCDTAASTFGKLGNYKTWDIISMKEVPNGLSGGISKNGTLAGCITILWYALIVSVPGIILFHYPKWWILYVCLVSIASMFLDSILGSLFQYRYQCIVCKRITDNKVCHGVRTVQIKKYAFLSNTAVNFATNFVIVLIQIIAFGGK